MIEVRTQAELDKALRSTRDGRDELIACIGDGEFVVRGSATVRAWGSATVEAGDSATVRAGDSATVRAWGSATVEAWDSATVRAAPHTPVIKSADAGDVTISGGVIVEIPVPQTAEEWCSFHQVKVETEVDGEPVALLFKAISPELTAYRGFQYELGEIPIAPDWDGGARECGHGLHFSPSPFQAQEFCRGSDSRFIACPVKLADIHVYPGGMYPEKIKAPGCCGPIYEVDIDGEPIEVGS